MKSKRYLLTEGVAYAVCQKSGFGIPDRYDTQDTNIICKDIQEGMYVSVTAVERDRKTSCRERVLMPV